MEENFEKLLESLTYRFKSIFDFQNLSGVAIVCKVLLLMVLGLPFVVVEILGLLFAICSCFPVIGIIFVFTFCLLGDLLSSGLFYLIMLPNVRSSINTVETIAQKKLVRRIKFTEAEYQIVYNALSWCDGRVGYEIEKQIKAFKDKMFLDLMSGMDGYSLLSIFNRIKIYNKDTFMVAQIDRAIRVLQECIFMK